MRGPARASPSSSLAAASAQFLAAEVGEADGAYILHALMEALASTMDVERFLLHPLQFIQIAQQPGHQPQIGQGIAPLQLVAGLFSVCQQRALIGQNCRQVANSFVQPEAG